VSSKADVYQALPFKLIAPVDGFAGGMVQSYGGTAVIADAFIWRHCEPTGRANALSMTGSVKQSNITLQSGRLDCSSLCSSQ
jgi:hypothetical protein